MGFSVMVCRDCGGSGIQRVADQRFRTCQLCLGQGRILRDALGGSRPSAAAAQPSQAKDISAAASSFAAR